LVCDITGATVTLVYTGATYGWNVAAQVGGNGGTAVTLTGTQTLTNKTLTGAAMNGTVGATTPSTGAFTSISASTTLGVTAGPISFFSSAPSSTVSGQKTQIGGNQVYTQISHGTQTSTAEYFYFINGNGTVGSIASSGSSTSYNTSSDYRLKNNISPMTGALAKVAQLKPVTYKWNADGADGEGFIAHELSSVCPQAVIGTKDGLDADGNPKYQAIDVSFLVATLTAAIQEQQALITTLTERITALEGV
jgi:hypothetical protein